MKTKRLDQIMINDCLTQKKNNKQFIVQDIIVDSENELENNFKFNGFYVRGKVMKYFFIINNNGEFIIGE